MARAAAHDVSFAAVVVAAGSGARYGGPKHALVLGGRALWQWSVGVFRDVGIPEVVVVGDVAGGVAGGQRRRDSVLAGLEALESDPDWVLIHDAARPLLSESLTSAVMEAARRSACDGVIPATAVTDTLKRTDGTRVLITVDRSELVSVQTPQAFRTATLLAAHRLDPADDATDDAALVERLGGTVVVVHGDPTNLKITFPVDLVIAEAILSERDR